MGLYPLSQYSVGTESNAQLRTTSIVQDDTLKLPYIEDFSGPGVPIKIITPVPYSGGPTMVYQITCVKMHGMKSGTNIKVFNASFVSMADSAIINGYKYVKFIDKYTFQLFDNSTLTSPTPIVSALMRYLNWVRIGSGGYSTIPDTLGYVANNGGVFINNDMSLNPISIGVATFDGVDYRGFPYSTSPTKGYADNLTSLPFNLSAYTPSSNICMSFYWQAKSLGDSPLTNEFLSLEFKNASGAWIEVWKKYGSSSFAQDTFYIAVVPITNASYLHKGFQYRFRSYGVLNGRFNVWNLDYIYINDNRTTPFIALKDISIVSTNRSALKNYTSVPYKHIRNLPVPAITAETDTAFVIIRNNFGSTTIDRFHLIRDNRGHERIKFKNEGAFNQQSYKFKQPFKDTIPGGYMDMPYVLKEEFYCRGIDTVGPINLSFNNFTAIETYFHDYYSYDDNIPEIAFLSVNAGGIKIANKFKILKSDQLTHMDYCFIKNNGPDMTNTPIFLNVWKNEPTITNSNTLINQQISIKYSPNINGFIRYELTTPLPLDSGTTYYFGYTQKTNNALFLGYDRNNDHLDKIFYCFDGINWAPFTDFDSPTGSLMIRPVFSTNEVITRVEDKESKQTQFTFFPNPAKDAVHFTGQPEYISVYDLSGLLLLEKKVEDTTVLSTEMLINGLYLVVFSKEDYKEVKRLIIQK